MFLDGLVEFVAVDAGLDVDLMILRSYRQHLVHPTHVHADTLMQRYGIPLEACARGVGGDRHATIGGRTEDRRDVRGRFGPDYRVGERPLVPVGAPVSRTLAPVSLHSRHLIRVENIVEERRIVI